MLELRLQLDVLLRVLGQFVREALELSEQRVEDLPHGEHDHVDEEEEAQHHVHLPLAQHLRANYEQNERAFPTSASENIRQFTQLAHQVFACKD